MVTRVVDRLAPQRSLARQGKLVYWNDTFGCRWLVAQGIVRPCSPTTDNRANELRELVPHLDPKGLAGGIFGPDDGFIDPYELCTLLAGMVRAEGGAVRQDCKLEGVTRARSGYPRNRPADGVHR